MDQRPLLSICIPTYNRLDIMYNTLNSIYADLDGVDLNDFEVIVSDNSPDHSTKSVITNLKYSNLKYYITVCDGYLNSFYALSYGKGELLKLHNNYTQLRNGTLKLIINSIKRYKEIKPVIFYTNGLKLNGKEREFNTFNSFMNNLSYFSSWSSGFTIWKEDFDKEKNIHLNKMYPQTSLLLSQIYKNKYIINDCYIFNDQTIHKKGGYNIFKVFSVDYIDLIKDTYINKYITKNTYNKIKKDLLYKYLSVRYFKTVVAKIDKFEAIDIKKNIKINYSTEAYYKMVIVALFTPIKILYRNIKRFRY